MEFKWDIGGRFGLAGLIVAFFAIAAFYIWPDRKSIGWVCLGIAVFLLLAWAVIELRQWWQGRSEVCQPALNSTKKLSKLKAISPKIELGIKDVVLHRTGDKEWRWRNGEFLVQVSAKLVSPPSLKVTYSAQLVFRGEVIELTAINDVENWEIIDREHYKHLGARPRANFVTNPTSISEDLTNLRQNEGWLHFRIEGMTDTQITKRTLRLYASAKNGSGSAHCDEELEQHHVVRSDLVAMTRYLPKPQ